MYMRNLWVGCVYDMDGTQHPVMVSGDEDFVHRFCQNLIEAKPLFYTEDYDVSLILSVVTEESIMDEESNVLDLNNYEEIQEEEFYEEIRYKEPQNGHLS